MLFESVFKTVYFMECGENSSQVFTMPGAHDTNDIFKVIRSNVKARH